MGYVVLKTIKAKVFLVTIIMVLIMAGTISVLYFKIYGNYRELRIGESRSTIELYATRVNNVIAALNESARNMALNGYAYYKAKDKDDNIITHGVKSFFETGAVAVGGGIWYEPYVLISTKLRHCFYAFNDEGVVRLDDGFESVEYDYHTQIWYRSIKSQVVKEGDVAWTPPYIDGEGTKAMMITVGAGIFDNGKFVGMSTIDWKLDAIAKSISEIHPTDTSFVLFADANNDFIFVLSDSFQKVRSGDSLKSISWFDINRPDESKLYYNGSTYYSFKRMLNNGMVIVINIPESELFKDINSTLIYTLCALLVFSLFMFFLTYYLLNRFITTPLAYIASKASEIGEGKFNTRIAVNTEDELGALANAFNRMTFNIKEYIDNLNAITTEKENIAVQLNAAKELQLNEMQKNDAERQLIFNNIDVPIWLYDAKGALLRINTAVDKIRESLLENGISASSICESVVDDFTEKCVIESGKQKVLEYSFGNRDYIIRVVPIIDEGGKVLFILKTGVDVTELNRLTHNERTLNACLEEAIKGSDAALAIENSLKEICTHLDCDYAFITSFDYEKSTIKTAYEYPVLSLMPQDRPLDINKDWYKKIEKGEAVWRLNNEQIKSEGSLISLMPFLSDVDGVVIYTSGIFVGGRLWGSIIFIYKGERNFNDLDSKFLHSTAHLFELSVEKMLAQKRLLEALKEAQDANKAKSFFLASVSHEIRTPLNAVIGLSELLKDGEIEKCVQDDYLENISHSSNALLSLINDVLDLSKLEAEKMQFNAERMDFAQLAAEIFGIFAHRLLVKKVVGVSKISEMPVLHLDKQRLRQVLFNLVGNAVKFTDKGSVTLAADFTAKSDCLGRLTLSVKDTGAGIPDADQATIFDPFVQSKSTLGTQLGVSGTGLGLTIAKRMVEEMGGAISLESKVGMGTTFTMVFEDVMYDNNPLKSTEEIEDENYEVINPEKYNLLLVDDVDMNLKVLDALLKKLNLKCASVNTPENALCVLENSSVHYDFILTDLWMPEMNGMELAQKIRQLKGYDKAKIVAVTADTDTKKSFEMSVFDDILTKPISIKQIRQLMRRLIG